MSVVYISLSKIDLEQRLADLMIKANNFDFLDGRAPLITLSSRSGLTLKDIDSMLEMNVIRSVCD